MFYVAIVVASVIHAIPVAIALRRAIANIKRFQFGLPELLLLPLSLTPSLLTILVAYHSDRVLERIFGVLAAIFFALYEIPFAVLFWAKGERTGWKPAWSMLMGAAVGTCAMIVWIPITYFLTVGILMLFG